MDCKVNQGEWRACDPQMYQEWESKRFKTALGLCGKGSVAGGCRGGQQLPTPEPTHIRASSKRDPPLARAKPGSNTPFFFREGVWESGCGRV